MNPVPHSLYPFEGQRVSVGDGIRMHYLDEGEGEPVLMLHGNPTWSFYYRRLVLGLRDRCRCVVPDHVGMGFSDRPGDDAYRYTLQRRIDDVETLVDRIGLKAPITLIAHDWGGMIGMAWAARDPSRVKRLVLMNTSAFALPNGTAVHWTLNLTRGAVGGFLVKRFNAFAAGAARVCVTTPMAPEVRRAYLAPYASAEERLATLRFVQDAPIGPDDPSYGLLQQTEASLGAFARTPTLILWGHKDFVFQPSFLAGWKERMPHAEIEEYPNAGHYVLEDRADDIIPRVQRFFDENP